MYKWIVLLFASLLIGGCSSTLPAGQIDWAYRVCEPNGGLDHMVVDSIFWPEAHCKNSAEFQATLESIKEVLKGD